MKKIVSLLLMLSLFLGLVSGIPVSAKDSGKKPEYMKGIYEYRIMGDDSIHKADAYLYNNSEIYVSADDAASMAGFEVSHENGMYTFTRIGEDIWNYLHLCMDEDGYLYGNQGMIPYYEAKDQSRWYSLMHLLRFLRAQFALDDTKEDDVAAILQAEPKDVISEWMGYGTEIEGVQLRQKDLYISHGVLATDVRSALSVCFDGGFDIRLICSVFGENEFIEDLYEDAIITLAKEDKEYYFEEEVASEEIVEWLHYNYNLDWYSELGTLLQFPSEVVEVGEWLNEINGANTYAGKVIGTMADIDENVLNIADGLGKLGKGASIGFDQIAILLNTYQMTVRSKSWKEDFIRGLELLGKTDEKLFESDNTINNIRNASNHLLEEYREPFKTANWAFTEDETLYLAELLLTKFLPGGAILGIMGSCAEMSDAALKRNVDIGKTSFLVDSLLDLQTVATRCLNYEISQALQEADDYGYISQEKLDRIRSWALLTLRITQRSYALVYALEMDHDPDFGSTNEAWVYRYVMYRALYLMGILSESADYDRNLCNPTGTELVSLEPLRIRENLSETVWRTCWVGGDIYDESGAPLLNAEIDVLRSNAPETIVSTLSVDDRGHWECELDNRYDYTVTVRAKDPQEQEYSDSVINVSVQKIDAEKNYFMSSTYMTKNSEEDFYEYLKKNVVPKIGVCSGASFKTKLEHKDMKTDGGTGLLSALVDDLDQDGSLEMVTVTVSEKEIAEDAIASLVYKIGEPCVSVDLDLYELEDGEVVHADGPRNIGYMERRSHGMIDVYAGQWEGVTYFTGFSEMEDETTYGPRATAIYHPEDGNLVFDYVAGGVWGQGPSRTDDNDQLNARKKNFKDTTIQTSMMEVMSELEFKYEFVKGGNSNVDVSLSDRTYLSEALENGYEKIREQARAFLDLLDEHEASFRAEHEEELRRKEEVLNSAAGKTAKNIIQELQTASGISLTQIDEYFPNDGGYYTNYKTDGQAKLFVETQADGTVVCVSVNSGTDAQTDEFIALKDAILRLPELSVPADKIEAHSKVMPKPFAMDYYGIYQINISCLDTQNFKICLN